MGAVHEAAEAGLRTSCPTLSAIIADQYSLNPPKIRVQDQFMTRTIVGTMSHWLSIYRSHYWEPGIVLCAGHKIMSNSRHEPFPQRA